MVPNQLQDQLQFIEEFADMVANAFKDFAKVCRNHVKKSANSHSDYSDLQQQLIEEKKKRIQLEDKIKQKISGGTQPNDMLPTNGEERRRPKNAYFLFVADQRQKILREHPKIQFSKITLLASIKWKNMAEEDRKVYENRFTEICKLYDENVKIRNHTQHPEIMVKREDEGNQRENQDDLQKQDDGDKEKEENQPMGQPTNVGTMLIQNQPQIQSTMPMEPVIGEQILNLFHTPASLTPQNQPIQTQLQPEESKVDLEISQKGADRADESEVQRKQERQLQNKDKQLIKDSIVQQKQKNCLQNIEPSLQIIEHVVIDPTIQPEQQ